MRDYIKEKENNYIYYLSIDECIFYRRIGMLLCYILDENIFLILINLFVCIII